MLPCLQKQLFGNECMGCGFQRSIVLLLKGDFVEAFIMYPAIYPLMGLLSIILYTTFFKLKYSSTIVSVLGVVTVLTIISNYLIKLYL